MITTIIIATVMGIVMTLVFALINKKSASSTLGETISDYTGKVINSRGINLQFMHAIAVTKSDTTVLPPSVLFVGGAGALTVEMLGGEEVVFSAVPAGTTIPILVTKVKAATTATSIVALQ